MDHDEIDHDDILTRFMAATGTEHDVATFYLTTNDWDLSTAIQTYFADEEDEKDGGAAPTTAGRAGSSTAPTDYTGPRTLDGRPAPQAGPSASSASSSKRHQKKKGLATLSSIGGDNAHDDDDDDDDDDRDDAHRDTYAGGEKSGLAVQDPSQRADPKRIINDLLSKAKSNAQRPDPFTPAGPSTSSHFRGGGQTLGGEGTESRVVPDPHGPLGATRSSDAPRQTRILHLWPDGFSIDDGELRRFDDPANAEDLRMIQSGRAPIHLMNVRHDEPIDVKLQQHTENYRPLPKVYRPFGGQGRRLGSPVPGEAASAPAAAATTTRSVAATSGGAGTSASSSTAAPTSSVDESQPTITIRIQMPDGTRLPARFNTSQTVNDIYDFISRASPELRTGGWVLATTFPNKDHTDKSVIIGDMAEFKKGGTAVVKRSA
ncbi:hypothetical protein F5Y14DRAFT_441987 [Nemania sp. NC0429]|nr:hypothetical protein F5Y14DRAFT_441987 [Nemania sp. NC0429]